MVEQGSHRREHISASYQAIVEDYLAHVAKATHEFDEVMKKCVAEIEKITDQCAEHSQTDPSRAGESNADRSCPGQSTKDELGASQSYTQPPPATARGRGPIIFEG